VRRPQTSWVIEIKTVTETEATGSTGLALRRVG
jgi:hypothetical protein